MKCVEVCHQRSVLRRVHLRQVCAELRETVEADDISARCCLLGGVDHHARRGRVTGSASLGVDSRPRPPGPRRTGRTVPWISRRKSSAAKRPPPADPAGCFEVAAMRTPASASRCISVDISTVSPDHPARTHRHTSSWAASESAAAAKPGGLPHQVGVFDERPEDLRTGGSVPHGCQQVKSCPRSHRRSTGPVVAPAAEPPEQPLLARPTPSGEGSAGHRNRLTPDEGIGHVRGEPDVGEPGRWSEQGHQLGGIDLGKSLRQDHWAGQRRDPPGPAAAESGIHRVTIAR